MDRKYFLIISGITLVVLAIAILAPGGRKVDEHPKLPWLVQPHDDGTSTVFGITLDKTTLAQARDIFREQGETNLFVSPDEELSVETYFERLFLSGLKADFVLRLKVADDRLKEIYERGLRISQLGSGAKKVTLTGEDMQKLANAVVDHITYLPVADLNAKLLQSRFGEPVERIREESGIEHWLYPDKGLDIAYNPEGKEVFQYVSPARFRDVVKPLKQPKGSFSEKI